jgi:hypothetical protein
MLTYNCSIVPTAGQLLIRINFERDWVLKGNGLRLGYGRHVLFDDISFEVVRGEILAIVATHCVNGPIRVASPCSDAVAK